MSNTIYSAILPVISQDKNKYNYVYQITEISTGIKYIGSRGSKKLSAIKDLKKYKSSTKDDLFKQNQKLNPLNYYYEILSYHPTRTVATNEEARLHALYDVKNNPLYYNRSNQTPTGFDTVGRVTVRDKYGNTSSVLIDDPRYLSGELVHHTKGKLTVKDNNIFKFITVEEYYLNTHIYNTITKNKIIATDKNNNYYRIDKNDPRYLSGELTDINKNKIVVKDKYNNYYRLDKNDPRYLSGELVGINKNKPISEDTKLKLSNALKKKYYIEGKIYNSRDEAAIALNVTVGTITNRCKSSKYKDYYVVKY